MTKRHFSACLFKVALFLLFSACDKTANSNTTTSQTIIPDPQRFATEIDEIKRKSFDLHSERIVFTGSSSIRFWKDLQTYYPNHQIINTGFGGSEMSDLLFHLEPTVLRFKPSKVFIYEGDNDISADAPYRLLWKTPKR